MGSSQQITFIITYFTISLLIQYSVAEPDQLHEERREFQYQRSSQIIGSSSGYYNSDSGQYEQYNSDLDNWAKKHRDQVHGMAEKLRSQYNAAMENPATNRYYQTSSSSYVSNSRSGNANCNICAIISRSTGKTEEELDTIAKDMTDQIIADMQSGKLVRNQINQPNWFEHRVAQKLEELSKQHQVQYQYQQPIYYTGSSRNSYSENREDLQQSQQNVFNSDDLRQIQQSLLNQGQSGFYQGQSQSQHSYQSVPVNRYYNVHHTAIQDDMRHNRYPTGYYASNVENTRQMNEEHTRTVYPTPIVITSNVQTENQQKNYSRETENTGRTYAIPHHYGYTHTAGEDHQIENVGHYIRDLLSSTTPTAPQYDNSYYSQRNYEKEQQRRVIPQYPTTSRTVTVNVNTTRSEDVQQHSIPTPFPTQRTEPPTVVVRQDTLTQQSQQSEIRNKSQVLQIPQPTRTTTISDVQTTQMHANRVEVQTPTPTISTTGSKHSIYSYLEESEVLPNYQPRVVIDKNTEFHTLTHNTAQETINDNQIWERESLKPMSTVFIDNKDTQTHDVHVQENFERSTQSTINYTSAYDHQMNIYNQSRTRTHFPVIHTEHREDIDNSHLSTGVIGHTRIVPLHTQRTYQIIDCTTEEYRYRLRLIQDELSRLGYERLSESDYNATIATGGFIHNGYKYVFNNDRRRFEKGERIEITDQEYRKIHDLVRNQLEQDEFSSMSEKEINQTIYTGVYIRGGYKWFYNSEAERFERTQISTEEQKQIFNRLKEILIRKQYRQLSDRECKQFMQNGIIVRGGYRWIYNYKTGLLLEDGHVDELAELSQDEYNDLYRKIQEILRSLGYKAMNEIECNATIISGSFERGGIRWTYNQNLNKFERVELTQDEYRHRIDALQYELNKIGYKQLSTEEYREIIYKGYFYHDGFRYEYNSKTGLYEKLELSEEEYRQRLQRLQDQLKTIGYGVMSEIECNRTIFTGIFNYKGFDYKYNGETMQYERLELTVEQYRERLHRLQAQLRKIGYGVMSEAKCNITISTGIFHYGGYEWVYNSGSGYYEIGNKSDKEEAIIDNNVRNQVALDKNEYGTTVPVTDPPPKHVTYNRRPHTVIHKNRGDQPPQHFEDDYVSEEILEQEPGIGYYPIDKKPEIGLAPPGTFNHIVSPYRNEDERKRYEMHLTHQLQPAVDTQVEYERRYQRTQSTHTKITEVQPHIYASPQTPLHNLHYTKPTNISPTEVGSEESHGSSFRMNRHNGYGDDLQKYEQSHTAAEQIYSRQPRNTSHHRRNYNDAQITDNQDNGQQQLETFNLQNTEDVQQQTVDFGQEIEDFGQQIIIQPDFQQNPSSSDKYTNSQQRQKVKNVDLSQQSIGLNQNSENLGQESILQTDYQTNVNSNDKYQSQLGSRQQNRNNDLTQQTVDFGQDSEDLGQQTIHQNINSNDKYQSQLESRQQNRNNDLRQQTIDIGQESENLEQQQIIQTTDYQHNANNKLKEDTQQIEQIQTSASADNNIQEIQAKVVELPKEEEKLSFWQRFKQKAKDIIG